MNKNTSGSFLQPNPLFFWAGLAALLVRRSLFCPNVLWQNRREKFSCVLRKGACDLAMSINFITKPLNYDWSHHWHHIKLCSNPLNLGNHISLRNHRSWLTMARQSDLGVLKHCIIPSVEKSELKSHLLEGQVFPKSKGCMMSSPIHLPWRYQMSSKSSCWNNIWNGLSGYRKYRGKNAVSLPLSISNEQPPRQLWRPE